MLKNGQTEPDGVCLYAELVKFVHSKKVQTRERPQIMRSFFFLL